MLGLPWGWGGARGCFLSMEVFLFKDLPGRHNAFKTRDHIMGKVEWPIGGCLAFIRDSSLLSKGPWPLLPSSVSGSPRPLRSLPASGQACCTCPVWGSHTPSQREVQAFSMEQQPLTCLSFSEASCLSPPRDIMCDQVTELCFPLGSEAKLRGVSNTPKASKEEDHSACLGKGLCLVCINR